MALDKSIEYGKEKRKPYRGAKAVSCSCRNHGSCEYCTMRRLFFDTKKKMVWEEKLRTWLEEE